VLLCLALACGGLAASRVSSRERAVEAQVGAPVPVLVAREDLAPGTRLSPATASRVLVVREVPERFAPRDSLASPEDAVGLRTAAPVPAGAYLTTAHLRIPRAGGTGAALGRGERAMDVSVAGGEGLGGEGARVDVLVTTEPGAGAGRSYVAMEDVELLGARGGGGGGGGSGEGAGGGTVATLRVTLKQAVFLAAAQSFAREIRLLARPPEDRARGGPAGVSASEL